jgi:hypothetical protein
MYPNEMAVKITDTDHDLHGITGFILNNPNDGETHDGARIPDGWVEVIFDPMDTHGYQTELFRENNLDVCGC